MLRLLPFVVLCSACASLPEVESCDAAGAYIEPSLLNIGNEDLMIASLQYTGCPDYPLFDLCGVGPDWFTEEEVRLAVWHDGSATDCDEEVLVDEAFNLGIVRRRYEKEFDVDAATVRLVVGSVEVDYSFADDR
jgi:hypothetical protein